MSRARDDYDEEKPLESKDFDGPQGEEERIPLTTNGEVAKELAKVYRAMRASRIPIQAGNGLTQTLMYLSKVLTTGAEQELLRRLNAIESKQVPTQQ